MTEKSILSSQVKPDENAFYPQCKTKKVDHLTLNVNKNSSLSYPGNVTSSDLDTVKRI